MNVTLYDRAFRLQATSPKITALQVASMSWSVIGGPKRAQLTASDTVDPETYLNWLRYGVSIEYDGLPVWWGYINSISAGGLSISMNKVANSVRVHYGVLDGGQTTSNAVTGSATNTVSISELGTKMYLAEMQSADAATAEARRDMYLSQHYNPKYELAQGGRRGVTIECLGWYETLGWIWSTLNWNTVAWADFDEWIVWLQDDLLPLQEFLTAGRMTAGTPDIEECWDWTNHKELVEEWTQRVGYSDGRRALTTVQEDRTLDVYPEPAEAVTHSLDIDGNLFDSIGKPVAPERCTVGVWATIKDIPIMAGGIASARPGFIEEAEYSNGKCRYRFADMPDPFDILELK
jgi:hypothetical protein